MLACLSYDFGKLPAILLFAVCFLGWTHTNRPRCQAAPQDSGRKEISKPSSIVDLIQEPGISKSEALEDLEYLVSTIEEVHFSPYDQMSKREFELAKQELMNQLGERISLRKFTLKTIGLIALLNDGHTKVNDYVDSFKILLERYRFLPFRVRFDEKRVLRISEQSASSRIPDGCVIRKINGVDARQLYVRATEQSIGTEAMRNSMCSAGFPYFLFLNSIGGPYQVEFTTDDGIDDSIELEGLSLDDYRTWIRSTRPSSAYTFEIQDDVAIIRYNHCEDRERFESFCQEAFREIASKQISKLLVDIRLNGGGASDVNDVLLQYFADKPYLQGGGRKWRVSRQLVERLKGKEYRDSFGAELCDEIIRHNIDDVFSFVATDEYLTQPTFPPDFFKGEVCVIIGPETYSSANMFADAIKTFGLGTIVGSPSGQSPNCFGEQLVFNMPNSKLKFYCSCTFDIGADRNSKTRNPIEPDRELDASDPRSKSDNAIQNAIKVMNW